MGIIGGKLCGPFSVPAAVKLTSKAYTVFLEEHLLQWLDDLLSLRFKVVFDNDNALYNATMTPTSFLESQAFEETLLTWPPCSPDLNLIEHLLSILKRNVFERGEQLTSEDALRNIIVDVTGATTSCQIKQLTSLMDKKLFKLI